VDPQKVQGADTNAVYGQGNTRRGLRLKKLSNFRREARRHRFSARIGKSGRGRKAGRMAP
jgi:hypothetical protein